MYSLSNKSCFNCVLQFIFFNLIIKRKTSLLNKVCEIYFLPKVFAVRVFFFLTNVMWSNMNPFLMSIFLKNVESFQEDLACCNVC